MIHLGFDPAPPFVYGSHANALWHQTHRSLALYGVPETTFSIRIRDLSAVLGYVPSDEALSLGAIIPLYSKRLGIRATRRIVAHIANLAEPEDASIVLEKYEPEVTRFIVAQQVAQWQS
jgi:hypothetical protein